MQSCAPSVAFNNSLKRSVFSSLHFFLFLSFGSFMQNTQLCCLGGVGVFLCVGAPSESTAKLQLVVHRRMTAVWSLSGCCFIDLCTGTCAGQTTYCAFSNECKIHSSCLGIKNYGRIIASPVCWQLFCLFVPEAFMSFFSEETFLRSDSDSGNIPGQIQEAEICNGAERNAAELDRASSCSSGG